MSKNRYVSVANYAKDNKISTAAVYNRFGRGTLKFVIHEGRKLVDIESYSPRKAGRPTKT